MRALARVVLYGMAFLALPLGVGFASFLLSMGAYLAPSPAFDRDAAHAPAPPRIDPQKPTVAIVLGKDHTEVTDALGPYAVFQRSGAFNVVMVAEERRPVAMTGGLDVLPHYSLAELDAGGGPGPALIVVPNIPDLETNDAVRLWVKRHGSEGSLVMSVCAGAQMLASTGLMDGLRATTHWGDIARIEGLYPAVTWVRGQRYVDTGRVTSTAGILSGIDGSLHMIDRLRGRALAVEVARQMHYTDLRFLDDPSQVEFVFEPADAVVLLNAAYLWDRPTRGVALFDGVDELALATLYDTYATAERLLSVAPSGAVITARYGLTLLARRTPGDWPRCREILLPGRGPAADLAWLAPFAIAQTAATDEQFPFGPALLNMAARHDLPTARFAAKRLEYRMAAASSQGGGWWSMAVVYRPLLLGLLGVSSACALESLLRRRRVRRNTARGISASFSRA